MSTISSISKDLSLLTHNGDHLKTPKADQSNIYLGIGLWSVKDGLSEGLPVDVMQMLLSAALARSKIWEELSDAPAKVIILIADSMALREGADPAQVERIVHIYKRCLQPLLDYLNLKECGEIILSSALESMPEYARVLEEVDDSPVVKRLKAEDPLHHGYIRTQTAITRYMHKCRNVGLKVGWITSDSSKQLSGSLAPLSLKQWDELKFDRLCDAICPDTAVQYLYARAGMKQSLQDKHISVSEGCPYTAYSKDCRYIVQTYLPREIRTICPLQKRVAAQWRGVAEVCARMMREKLASAALLPKDCIQPTNAVATVYNMLNHWANPPPPSGDIHAIGDLQTIARL